MKLISEAGEKPLWSQLYDILSDRIKNGVYKQGDMLPTEMEIMKEFEVSRMTVRQSMNKLITDGIIERMRGKGTIVLNAENKIGTSLKSSFQRISEKNNVKNRKVISVEYCLPPEKVEKYFKLKPNEKVLRVIRESRINNTIVSIHYTYLSREISLNEKDDFEGSLYDKLEKLSYKINRINERITCSLMNDKQKELFGIAYDEALMCRERRGYSNDEPIEFTDSIYLSTGYELVIDLA